MFERRGLIVVFSLIVAIEGFVMVAMAGQQAGDGFLASASRAWSSVTNLVH